MTKPGTVLFGIIWLSLGSILYAQSSSDEVEVFSNDQIQTLQTSGFRIREPGEYTFWAWSTDQLPLNIVLDGHSMGIPPVPKAKPAFYSWKRLGKTMLQSDSPHHLQIVQGDSPESCKVGWLAFSRHDDWNPEHWFALSRVFSNSAEEVDDSRLGILRDNKSFYPFTKIQDKQAWLERRSELKTHILVSMGLYPQPEKTPLNPHISGRIEHEDYTVENIYFESLPGFFVSGNLYRPKGKSGPFAAILNPIGHWKEGRLTNSQNNSVPGRCINFAKRGYIALTIDMIGYVENQQLKHDFGSKPEWLWGLSLHGLQLWNTIRAIDFLLSLDDVDPNRIGCTGASGGGTQTYFLAAVDDRVSIAAPVNMISSHFQGGCLCENAPNLRIDAFNVEYASMIAPRPLLMICATGDWTDETLRVEYPAIRSVYELYGAVGRVHAVLFDAPHNYSKPSREAVYAWFGKWLSGVSEPAAAKELPFTVEPREKLLVFPKGLPERAVTQEGLIKYWIAQSESQLNSLYPNNPIALQALKAQAALSLRHVLGAQQPEFNDLVIHRVDRLKESGLFVEKLIIGRKGKGDQIPAILLIPTQVNSSSTGILMVNGRDKMSWFDTSTGKPGPLLQGLLQQGHPILLADLFLTGEYDSAFKKAERQTHVDHFLTYNQTDTALRTQDILTALTYLENRYEVKRVGLIGGGEAGLWALLAAPLAHPLCSVIVDAAKFDSRSDSSYLDRLFVPGLRRIGDMRAAQSLLAPTPMMIVNTGGVFDTDWAKTAYESAGATEKLKVFRDPVSAEVILEWLNQLH